MTDCYFEKKDWRACKDEVSELFSLGPGQCEWVQIQLTTVVDNAKMELFKACWKRHNNDQRTSTKDA